MYRQYEDPKALENRLQEVKNQYEIARQQGQLTPYDEEDYYMYIADLKERINFAWQDLYEDEY